MNEPWNVTDAAALRAYLETQSGQKLIAKLTRPQSKGTSIEETALAAKFADGVDYARNQILSDAAFNKPEVMDQTSRDLITLGKEEPR